LTFVDKAWVIIGSRTDSASIVYKTNKMGVFVKDLEVNHDCCYYEIPFKEPIEIWAFGDPTIITATAKAPGKGESRAVSPKYQLIERLLLPEIHPSSGVYERMVQISIGDVAAATIHVTLDGSTPTCSSPLYNVPHVEEELQVGGRREVVVKAIACQQGYIDSQVATVNYVLQGPSEGDPPVGARGTLGVPAGKIGNLPANP